MAWHKQVTFWLTVLGLFIAAAWLLSSVLLPFVAGLALAYFLNPVTTRLERWGVNRLIASLVTISLTLLLAILLMLLVVPIFGSQLAAFIQRLPEYISKLQNMLTGEGANAAWLRDFVGDRMPSVQSGLNELVSQGATYMLTLIQGLWTGGQALLSVFSLLVITPVVAFYILNDWEHMVDKVDSWLPVRHRGTIRDLAGQMDRAIAGFVRGQSLVCLILGSFYAISLTMSGLNFGFVIGFVSGIITFIPYVGSLTGLVLAGGVAIVQFFPDYSMIAIVIGIFVFGQFIEGYILSPKLVGDSVGLHPVWLMFALLAFGYLLGFLGLLLAVPLAAAVGVLVRFAINQYLESPLYTGEDEAELHSAPAPVPYLPESRVR
ncbi:AI-2E family transporter [Ancylobacter dichloromethanicus]|uniref:AI-2E family transporter n=1 Tax=Ancylobacter dichloromethanicus TaxID=518825 RepID=A0A9W6MZK0_9HYPH|nr:AI-2E family transporter [Ancylobacter dichloromethanicus]MBS7555748.1 AI-2E family transporter [Ancylobacter dichloromethanicus]GLK72819.1 AI-2E family transporter [Ancylobacter dichloromethanicus]